MYNRVWLIAVCRERCRASQEAIGMGVASGGKIWAARAQEAIRLSSPPFSEKLDSYDQKKAIVVPV